MEASAPEEPVSVEEPTYSRSLIARPPANTPEPVVVLVVAVVDPT
jgi:hypothetical protein